MYLSSLSAAIIMKFVYGYERDFSFLLLSLSDVNITSLVSRENDAFVKLADSALRSLSKATIPGSYWVEFLPLCEI